MKRLVLVFGMAFALCSTAMATDIAISTQAGWFGQAAADREMQEIVDNVTGISVEQFTADQQDALADWVVAHTGDGVSDILILCGNFPDTIYPPGNAQPDGSLAELFLDDGNTIINTGDYLFYVNSGGTNNNGEGGIRNMMDIPGITMWDDNTSVVVTAEGQAVAPSLQDFQTDRPFHLDELEGDWVPELILAQNEAGTRADPVIVMNTATGGRLGIFYQTAGQDDDPRGEVISEWINNYILTGGVIPNSPAWKPDPADGTIEVDTSMLMWNAGLGAVLHIVYLSEDATIDDADMIIETDMAAVTVDLVPGTTYYWRVDEVDADGAVIEGDLWSFTTIPLEAHFPVPADGATLQPVDTTLSWTPGKVVVMHDVYFDSNEAAVTARDMSTFKGKLITTEYDPGPLELETTYYWAVDEFTPTGTVAGPVWSFTTIGSVPITDPDLMVYYDFESGEGAFVIDQSGHSNHGTLQDGPTFVPGKFGQALAFDGSRVAIPASDSLAADLFQGSFALSAWINPTRAGNTWQQVFRSMKADDTSNDTLFLNKDGRLSWRGRVNGAWAGGMCETASDVVPAGQWTHIAVMGDGTNFRIYVNGIVSQESAFKITDGTNAIYYIGGDPGAPGESYAGSVDDLRVYAKTLTDVEILALAQPQLTDVTAPGDVVKGVPDEPRDGDIAGWPDGEYPALATDDDVSTKYLHFRGEVSPTGFVIEPAMGATIVTGLTFTTANDSPERDPISFELSGSNESIDGPYELIAAGDIVDFAQEANWPRFTKNATPITFENTIGYTYYQLMFPAVRNPGGANSMQIAEVELIGERAPLYVEDFESYTAGDPLHGVGGWAGWGGDAGAGAPVSDAFAYSGVNSVEVVGSADLVQEFDVAGGQWEFSAMQYIPSGTTGTTYFILMNQYGATNDWSVQTTFNLDTGVVGYWHTGVTAPIVYDEWIELKYAIDLDNNTVDKYYNGELIATDTWDDGNSGMFGALDLYGNGASSVYYDDIVLK